MRPTSGSESRCLTLATDWRRSGNERIRTTRSIPSGNVVCLRSLVRRRSGRGGCSQWAATATWRCQCFLDLRRRRTSAIHTLSSTVEQRRCQLDVRSSTPLAGKAANAATITATIAAINFVSLTSTQLIQFTSNKNRLVAL